MRPVPRPAFAAMLVPLLLGACARHHPPASVADDAAPPPPRPVLEPGLASVKPPVRDAAGQYRTINSDTDPQQTIWHVRAALNVAAIGCRGADDAGLVPAYNAMLTSKKAVLAAANKAFVAGFASGGSGQSASDTYMTRLYNFFAMPAAKPGFCAAAAALAPEAASVPPAAFPAFAEAALPKLEAPFLAVYRAVDDYRVASAAWDARYGQAAASRVETASAAPARTPRLAYAELDTVIAWQPSKHAAYASR